MSFSLICHASHDDPLKGVLIIDGVIRFLDTFSEVGDNYRKPGMRAWEGCSDSLAPHVLRSGSLKWQAIRDESCEWNSMKEWEGEPNGQFCEIARDRSTEC